MTAKKFFSYALMSLGGLTAFLSGGCSLIALNNLDGQYLTPESVAIVGGVPFVIGTLMFFTGKWMKSKTD